MGKGRSYMNSYADGYMRGKVVKEVGALLEHMIVEEITTPTISLIQIVVRLKSHLYSLH